MRAANNRITSGCNVVQNKHAPVRTIGCLDPCTGRRTHDEPRDGAVDLRARQEHVGWDAAQELDAHVTVAINDLAQKYDRFCSGATESFHNKSRAWSVVVSFVLAFALNIDAIHVFDSLLREAPLRQAIIDQQSHVEQALRAAEAPSQAAQVSPSGKDEFKEVHAILAQIQAKDAELLDAGLPIGLDVYPWCHQREDAGKAAVDGKLLKQGRRFVDARCSPALNWPASLGKMLAWVFSVALAGFLIGLGAPFWFNVATGLSKSMKLLKAMGVGERGGQTDKGEGGAQGARTAVRPAVVPPRTPFEAFRTAIDASTPVAAARMLLSPTGEIDRGE